jgi:hypothetical protein
MMHTYRRTWLRILILAALATGIPTSLVKAEEAIPATVSANKENSRLAVVWTSADPDVAHRVCLMYTHAAAKNKWFEEVRLVVWGPSARLLAGDKDLQAKLKAMQKDGVILQACVVCADSYGVSETLRGLGIEVKGMGKPLTELLQSDCKVLTF